MNHELVDGTLYVERTGIIGRCTCGWDTGHRFSSFTASVVFMDHKKEKENEEARTTGQYAGNI